MGAWLSLVPLTRQLHRNEIINFWPDSLLFLVVDDKIYKRLFITLDWKVLPTVVRNPPASLFPTYNTRDSIPNSSPRIPEKQKKKGKLKVQPFSEVDQKLEDRKSAFWNQAPKKSHERFVDACRRILPCSLLRGVKDVPVSQAGITFQEKKGARDTFFRYKNLRATDRLRHNDFATL